MSDLFQNESIIIDMLIRLTILENVLVDNGLISKDKMQEEYVKAQIIIAKDLLTKAGIDNPDDVIKEIKDNLK